MIKKILVPLDGSKSAEKALPYAEALAQKFEAELILVQVLQPTLQPIPAMSIYGETAEGAPQVFQDESEADNSVLYLKTVQDKLQFPAHIEVLEDRPKVEAIIAIACREWVDLIVMHKRGRSCISRWINGKAANKVLQGAPCPVFFV